VFLDCREMGGRFGELVEDDKDDSSLPTRGPIQLARHKNTTSSHGDLRDYTETLAPPQSEGSLVEARCFWRSQLRVYSILGPVAANHGVRPSASHPK
jgi:hypothetical protein